jgi:hypothetical protein
MQEVHMKHAITACLICIILTGCVPLEDPRPFSPGDLRPPSYLGLKQDDDVSLTLRFSESVTAVSGETAVSASDGSPIPIEGMDDGAAQVSLRLAAAPEPGERCVITIRVADSGGNSLRALIPFYGLNTSLPPIIISEFTTQGSSTSPDMVELLVLEAGNTAGAVLCEGVDGDAIQKMVLPPIDAAGGDYIIVHFKPQGIPEEIDESVSKAESGGLKAHPEAWDLWVPGGSGLSGNNGVISLYNRPGGDPLDGVLYSNRTSSSDTDYDGFGSSAVLQRARELVRAGMWHTAEEAVRPEDAVNPDPSTATRSIFRMPGAADTNGAADWFIAPTSGATFGTENGTEVYAP